ncbi:MAG: SpoIIE family protein phosphatase [Leptospiraceae bacterium]|nr:SpoIIE family protein phosphatase [Leptospiraceae bacterium]MCP5492984.1 SpoIIE family protein phosphatase [Leptospiraceae bacterium]
MFDFPSESKPNSKIYFNPEISVKRVFRLLYLFNKGHYIDDNDFNYLQDIIDEKVLKKILEDRNYWISQNLEDKIIKKLFALGDITQILYDSGKDFFLSVVNDVLPSDNIPIDFSEFLFKLPIMINRYSRYALLFPQVMNEKSIKIEIQYTAGCREKWYDLVYLKGIIDQAAGLFGINNCYLNLLQTSCKPPGFYYDEMWYNAKYNSTQTILLINWDESNRSIARTNIENAISNIATKTFLVSSLYDKTQEKVTSIDLSELQNKLEELHLANREMEAAVEVLKEFKKKLNKEYNLILKDIKIAKNIQQGIIPQRIPDWEGLQFAVKLIPFDKVSGDYYDYFHFDSNGEDSRLGILVSDVSGHGVPAAFITAIAKLIFANYKLDSPSDILINANNQLIELVKQQSYLTCFYGIINSNHEITYSLAGHPRPILLKYQTGEAITLEGEGTFIGMFSDAREYFKDFKINLEPGDKLFIFTDGLTEALSDEDELFAPKLMEAIKLTREMNVEKSLEYIFEEYQTFTLGTERSDDITLLVLGLNAKIEEFELFKKNAIQYIEKKQYESACQELLRAYEILPRDLKITFLLGKTYVILKDYQAAIDYLTDYNSFKTYNAESHYLLGCCYFKQKNYGRAEEELKRAVSLNPDNIRAMYILAKTYYMEELKEQAVYTLNKILSIDKNFKSADLWLRKIEDEG